MPRIKYTKAHKILNSRGEEAIRVEMGDAEGNIVFASAPKGVSAGSHEAVSLPAEEAIRAIEEVVTGEIADSSFEALSDFDEYLVDLDGTADKSRLGSNSTLSLSIAMGRLLALSNREPLWSLLKNEYGLMASPRFPKLFVNLIEGGVHAESGLQFQEYLAIVSVDDIGEATDVARRLYSKLKAYLKEDYGGVSTRVGDEGGFAPAMTDDFEPLRLITRTISALHLEDSVHLGIDAAGNEVTHGKSELDAIYSSMASDYGLQYLEDPYGENDFVSYAQLMRQLARFGTFVCGDDLTVTNLSRIKTAAREQAVNSVIIKPNQIGTLTEAMAAVKLVKSLGWQPVASHRGGETNDDFIADFAFASGCYGIKLGSPARGERVAKYNRFTEIGRELEN